MHRRFTNRSSDRCNASHRHHSRRRSSYYAAFTLTIALGGELAAAGPDTRAALNVIYSPEVEAQLAVSAAPSHLRENATVYTYRSTGYALTRQGSNGFTCLVNRDGFFYGSAALKPTCWDSEGARSYVPVMLRVGELLAAGRTLEEIRADIDNGFESGRFRVPRTSGVAYMLAGDLILGEDGRPVRQAYPAHYMFYAPSLHNADLGYARNGDNRFELPYIFSSGAGGDRLGYIIVHATAPAR